MTEQVSDGLIDFGVNFDFTTKRFGEPTDDEWEIIQKRMLVSLEKSAVWVMPSVPSTQSRDSHMTRMSDSTLRNYAADAKKGVPVMNSHRTGSHSLFTATDAELPLGRSFAGEYDEATKRTISRAYFLRGVHPNGQSQPSTDDLIRQIEGGIITDVSVGFELGTRGKLLCGVCDANCRSFKTMCDHVPGTEYPDQPEEKRYGFYWVENAHLREYSPVFSGSTPGAVIGRVTYLYEQGRIDQSRVLAFEDRSGVRMVKRFAGVEIPTPARQEKRMTPAEFFRMLPCSRGKTIADDAELPAVAALIQEAWTGVEETARLAAEEKFKDAGNRLAAMETRAKMGDEYIAALIEETVTYGVRVMGNTFPKEATEAMLKTVTDIATIRSMRDGYKQQAEKLFGAAGIDQAAMTAASLRMTTPGDPDARANGTAAPAGQQSGVSTPPKVVIHSSAGVPDEAYRTGFNGASGNMTRLKR